MGTWLKKLIPHEKHILKELQLSEDAKTPNPIIAIGGLSGTGKDTLAANIKTFMDEYFDNEFEIMSAGRFIREFASGKGYDEVDMDHFVTTIQDSTEFREKMDLVVDHSILKTALEKGGIFVGRMAPFTIGDWGLTIYLKCEPTVVAKRLISDPKRAEWGKNYQQIVEKIITRDAADMKRLSEFYETSFDHLIKKVDLVIDTGTFSVNGALDIAKSAIIDYFNIKKR